MTTTCPVCNKPVDPLRSRFVGVVGGKVVAFCSAEHAGRSAGAASPAPLPAAAAPAAPAAASTARPAAAVASAPSSKPAAAVSVPTGARTPSTGVPEPARPSTPVSGIPVSLDSGPVIEIVQEASGSTAAKPAEAKVAEAAKTPKTPKVPKGTISDAKAGADKAPEPPHQPGAPGAPGARGSKPEAKAGGKPEGKTDENTEKPSGPRAKHPDEIAIGAFWSTDKARNGTAPAATGRDDTLDRWATPDAGDRSGARALSSTDELLVRKSRLPLVLVILLVLGAGGFLAYQYLVKPRVSASIQPRAPAVSGTAVASVIDVRSEKAGGGGGRDREPAAGAGNKTLRDSESAPVAPPPPVDPEAAIAQARARLAAELAATSPRLQRLSAAALARTQDPAARELLAAHLGAHREMRARGVAGVRPETSDIARLGLAYALARGGDARGSDALAAALASPRAEARDEAARLLALLGDRRAVPRLVDVLAVSQRRLGAAEHLAYLAEPRAIKVLAQLRGDARASADDRARATIALGVAGHADVAPALREMLGDPQFNAFAAAALAELKDAAARPVLERQLESPALRVRSARALRRLDPALDASALLPRLLEVLRSGRDTDQVQAAEAILLLAGPAAWSAYE